MAAASIGFAPTMGYLHEGHLSLFRAAKAENECAVASIFVNPTQFAPNEDLDAYPRDLEGDTSKAASAGIDILWIPPEGHVYALDHSTTVLVDDVSTGLCGGSRPTHFAGVATVVAKLFNLVEPSKAYFGKKDFQQLAVIRRMVRDLNFPIEVIGMPIVRDADGVAVSSRNAYLSDEQRKAARLLNQSLDVAESAFADGERDPARLLALVQHTLAQSPLGSVDYTEVVDPESLAPLLTPVEERVLIALAVRFGATRLIDNRLLGE